MDPRVAVSLVTWNSARVLAPCLDSLAAQRGVSIALTIVDNASLDESLDVIASRAPQAALIRNTRNAGFSRAHNQALLLSSAPYALVLNPDTVLEPHALARLVAATERDPSVGAVGPKLRRYELTEVDGHPVATTTTIDSAGIVTSASGTFRERGAGEADRGQYDEPCDVFALSGACLLIRRSALRSIRLGNELFDEDFFAYKEDVDLGWRLRRRGWRCRYEPAALVYHRRALATPPSRTAVAAIRAERRRTDQMRRTLSYRNHLLTYVKNARLSDLLHASPLFLPYELGKLVYLAAAEPRTLAGLAGAIRLAPRLWRKRSQVLPPPS